MLYFSKECRKYTVYFGLNRNNIYETTVKADKRFG
jgi:hypothetical protein